MTKEPGLRLISLEALMQITEKKQHSHKVLNMVNEKYAYLKKEDRAFISRLVHGSLEYLLQIDYVINLYSKVPVNKQKPLIRNVLRLSVYQILYMDKVPDSAACNEAIKLVEKRGIGGLKGFVNGVLRAVAREKEQISFDSPGLKYSVPQWIMELFAESLKPEEIEKILAAFVKESPLSIRINENKCSVSEAVDTLKKEGLEVSVSDICPNVLKIKGFDRISDLDILKQKKAYVQDASSALAIKALDIKKGSTVFDVCAAPGGKSINALDVLGGSGELYAFDVSEKKLGLLKENLKKYSSYDNVNTIEADASVFNESYVNKADYIIADLPCSGLGILGKKADIKLNMTRQACMGLSDIQQKILNNVCRYLKKGGKLLFSTCTIDHYENEDNVKRFLKENPDFTPVDFSAFVKEDLKEEAKKGYLRLLPGIHSCDGFFISIFEKN